MSKFLFFIFCLIGTSAFSQDLSGIWRGHFLSGNNRLTELLGYEDRYKFELQIDQNNKKFAGVTYSYKTTVFYGKATCQGTINPATRKVLLEELKIVEVKMSNGSACIMTCFLQYSKIEGQEFMEGTYISMNTRDSTNCGTGTIYLRKVETSDFYKEPFIIQLENERKKRAEALAKKPPVKKPVPKPTAPTTPVVPPKKETQKPPPVKDPQPPVVKIIPKDTSVQAPKKILPPPPPVLANRENELVKKIYAGAGKITISLYDNGAIDNDTVSVYINNKLVVNNERLTAQPISFTIDLSSENDRHEVVMVAENLGEIPPNTSLMVVRAGNEQYEVRITSTEQKNAVVVFELKK